MINQDELQYLLAQLDWFKEEARKYAERIEVLAKQLQDDASLARLDWARTQTQQHIKLTESLAGRLQQASSRIYWPKDFN